MPARVRSLAALCSLAVLACSGSEPQETEEELMARAQEIHERVMTVDTHVDINPDNFTPENSYATDLDTQVNLPKMEQGGLDAVFLIVYVGQEEDFSEEGFAAAHATAMEKFHAIHTLTKELAPDRIELALTSEDARRIYASGKKVAFIGVENGYPLGDDPANVQAFAELGARYVSLAHNGHSQLSDSNTGERDGIWMHNGLSPLGRQVVEELNRWGVMIDISHPSKEAITEMLALTRAPIIASHSAVRSLCDHSRNLDDEQLLALAENGGVIQTVAFNSYVKCGDESPERTAAMEALRKEIAQAMSAGEQNARQMFRERRAEIDAMYPPPPRATVEDFVNHVDYAVSLMGIDHVGISSDFDGGGGVVGWDDATETFNVTLELVRRGYSEEQIEKLWGGNLLRVLDEVQAVSRQMRGVA